MNKFGDKEPDQNAYPSKIKIVASSQDESSSNFVNPGRQVFSAAAINVNDPRQIVGIVPQLHTDIAVDGFSIANNVFAVDGLSTGLGIGMPKKDTIHTQFSHVLTSQKNLVSDTLGLNTKFNFSTENINSLFKTSLAPLSSSIASIGLSTVNSQHQFAAGAIDQNIFGATKEISSLFLNTINNEQSVFSSMIAVAPSDNYFSTLKVATSTLR